MRLMKVTLLVLIFCLAVPLGTSLADEHSEAPCEGLLVLDAYARPTVTPTGAAYGVFINFTGEDVTLLPGETEVADAVEIHEMTMSADGVMSMNPLPDGIVIPAGEAVALEPGGYHVMFIGVSEEIAEGAMVDFTLVVEGMEDPLTLSLPVQQPPDAEMDMDGMPMATEEAGGHDMGGEHGHDTMMKTGAAVGFGGCADLDLEAAEWALVEEEGMYMLHLKVGESEIMLPVTSLKHGMTMDGMDSSN